MLFKYANDVEALNDRKDALKNLFSAQKKPLMDALGAASNPKVGWSVFIQKSPAHGPVAPGLACGAVGKLRYMPGTI